MSLQDDLNKLLRSRLKRYQVPGASIAIMRRGKIIARAAAGVVNLDTRVPATTDSVFQIGSISKPLTATLIMQLVDQGRVELDSPVVTYLPEFRVADLELSRRVTIRQLLSHQSGIDGDFFVDSGRGDDNIARLLDKATMIPGLFAPGTKHSYCNLGYATLGRVIEVVTGKTFDQVLRDELFEPLAMDHAFSLPEDALRFRCAIGHVPSQSKKGVWYASKIPYLSLGQKAAGSTPSMSTGDLLKFAAMHMQGGVIKQGVRVLSKSSARAMQRKQIRLQKHSQSAITHWGLGWFLMDWNGHKLYGHDGATLGQNAYLRILPEKDLAVALLTNGGDAKALHQDLYHFAFNKLAKVTEPESAPIKNEFKANNKNYVGRYSNISGTFEISVRADRLTISSEINGGGSAFPDNCKLAFVDKHSLAMDTGDKLLDRMRFLFSEPQANGQFQYVATGLRQHKRDCN